ncbi:LEAF RUST 10 DISEASE-RESISTANCEUS RECEPTOR-LIKE PROTEIN KINASE-like 1.2 [Miscanthus floridulus]|uniref:LEAF RUST 10 DISEASE-RESISTANCEUS RECEPTOR-LIKE PROTEIN KINASE-like 1.2 n=1 Tax=Miscanthus floridulus TaxID=154761 RepID=UPI0034580A1D
MSANPPRLLATMAAHLPVPRLPVLLFVFLAVHVHVHVPASHAIPPSLLTTYDGSICSESFKCGGVNIRYPFYLADATREIADYGYNYSCGYTDLLISCQGEAPTGIPFITLGGDNYTVQNIFYDTHTIILVDSDVLVGGSCPAVRHNVSFNETWLHNSSAFDNLTFFFGCHLGDYMTLEFDAYKIKCADFKSPPDAGPGDSFVVMTDEHDRYPEPELPMHCNMIVTVPVNHDVLMVASNQQDFRSSGYGDVLKRGFELEWERVAADGCHQCEESNGRCAYSQHRDFLGCLCHGGKVGSPDCKRSNVLGNNSSSCGYPGLAIDCVDDKYPILQLGSGPDYSYNVTGIDYTNYTISLADPDVLDGDESCPVDHNVTVPPAVWLNLLPEYTVGYPPLLRQLLHLHYPWAALHQPDLMSKFFGWLLFFCDSFGFGGAPTNFVTGVQASYPSAGASERLPDDRFAMEHQRVPQRS